MPYDLDDKLVVGITSRALFDLDDAHRIFDEQGLEAYRAYQMKRETEPLRPGTGFPLVESLLRINDRAEQRLVEVILISRNDSDSGMRILNSIEASGIDITRSVFTDGPTAHRYLNPYSCDLFLSAQAEDVKAALSAGFPAALVYPPPNAVPDDGDQVRIAFDGDAVLFGDESEQIFQSKGLDAFQKHEMEMEDTPLSPGPFKGFLDAIARLQGAFPESDSPIRTALITARGAPAHKRPIKTFRAWGIRINESFFLGGIEKSGIIDAFRPHIYFDDQRVHLDSAAKSTPSAQVLSVPETPGPGA